MAASRRRALPLLAVVAAAAALRLAGLGHALPQRIDPDEVFATFSAWDMARAGTLRPPSLIWPSSIFYVLAAHFAALRAAGLEGFLLAPAPFALAARAVAAACGTLAVAAAGYGAARLAGPAAGVAAAALAAVLPTLVHTSHLPTTDPLVALWATAGLAACARVAAPGPGRLRRYLLAGALAGAAAGAKWNGAFLLVPLFAAHVSLCWRDRRPAGDLVFSSRLALAFAAAAAVFAATTPYALLEPGLLRDGLAEQARVFRTSYGLHGAGGAARSGGSLAAYAGLLAEEMGLGAFVALVGLLVLLRGRGPRRVWGVGILSFVLLMASQPRASGKYLSPILPALATAAGVWIGDLFRGIDAHGRPAAWGRPVAAALFLLALFAPAAAGLRVAAAWRGEDTREAARAWLAAHAAPGDTVATDFFHYAVDLAPYEGLPPPPPRLLPYVALADRGIEGLRADGARWLVTSSLVEAQSSRRDFYRRLPDEAEVAARFEGAAYGGVLNPTLTVRRLRGVGSAP